MLTTTAIVDLNSKALQLAEVTVLGTGFYNYDMINII
jgi:hypothetical protein